MTFRMQRRSALASLVLAVGGPATAQPSQADCRLIDDPSARLACYDREAGRPPSASPPRPEPAPPATIAPAEPFPVAPQRRDAAGVARVDGDDETVLAITAVGTRPDGKLAFRTSDGREWLQTDNVRVSRARSGQELRLERGRLGGLFGAVDGGPRFRIRPAED